MNIEYVSLIPRLLDLHKLPRDDSRFEAYKKVMLGKDHSNPEFPPMFVVNPMGKEHITEQLESLIRMKSDLYIEELVEECLPELNQIPGDFRFSLVIADDLMGGWTNRWSCEYDHRFGSQKMHESGWCSGLLWSSEPPTRKAIRHEVLSTIYRTVWRIEHGFPDNLRDMLMQEGWVMMRAGISVPLLPREDREFTRGVLSEFLTTSDMRTVIECLFGDEAGETLGFTPRGLKPKAGLALALYDAMTIGIPTHA